MSHPLFSFQSLKPPFHDKNNSQDYLLLTGHVISTIGALYLFIRGVCLFKINSYVFFFFFHRNELIPFSFKLIDLFRKRPGFQSLFIDGYTNQLLWVLWLSCSIWLLIISWCRIICLKVHSLSIKFLKSLYMHNAQLNALLRLIFPTESVIIKFIHCLFLHFVALVFCRPCYSWCVLYCTAWVRTNMWPG